MQQWHYTREGQQHGPIEEQELRRLAETDGLQRSDLVWTPGMPQWLQAGDARWLFRDPAATPATEPASDPALSRESVTSTQAPRPRTVPEPPPVAPAPDPAALYRMVQDLFTPPRNPPPRTPRTPKSWGWVGAVVFFIGILLFAAIRSSNRRPAAPPPRPVQFQPPAWQPPPRLVNPPRFKIPPLKPQPFVLPPEVPVPRPDRVVKQDMVVRPGQTVTQALALPGDAVNPRLFLKLDAPMQQGSCHVTITDVGTKQVIASGPMTGNFFATWDVPPARAPVYRVEVRNDSPAELVTVRLEYD
jgi:hypothetical protein